MAKSKLSWSLVDAIMTVEILATKTKVSFDMTKIFQGFKGMSDVQKKVIANGIKQKLADHLARPLDMTLTPVEMHEELKALWKRLCEGHWNKEGTGTRTAKLTVAWEKASKDERVILTKLGLKPKDVE